MFFRTVVEDYKPIIGAAALTEIGRDLCPKAVSNLMDVLLFSRMGLHLGAVADGGRDRRCGARVGGAPRAGGGRAARQELLRRAQAGGPPAAAADTGHYCHYYSSHK